MAQFLMSEVPLREGEGAREQRETERGREGEREREREREGERLAHLEKHYSQAPTHVHVIRVHE